MNISITLSTDNAAFEEHEGAEIARILRDLARKYEGTTYAEEYPVTVRDANGNTVGNIAYAD